MLVVIAALSRGGGQGLPFARSDHST